MGQAGELIAHPMTDCANTRIISVRPPLNTIRPTWSIGHRVPCPARSIALPRGGANPFDLLLTIQDSSTLGGEE